MGKRTYRAVEIKAVDVPMVKQRCGTRLIIGIDVAKEKQVAVLANGEGECVVLVKWLHPAQTVEFLDLCGQLNEVGLEVEAVMEPSGTYGDALRARLLGEGIEVHRMSGKRVRDAAEVFDGVASMHDPKAAVVIAKLHAAGMSEKWPLANDYERELDALYQCYALYHRRHLVMHNRLEALTARHWPELTRHLSLDSKTFEVLLKTYGSPADVAADPAGARTLMEETGGWMLAEDKVEAVLSSASTTVGVPMLASEVRLMKVLAGEALRARAEAHAAKKPLHAKAGKELEASLVKMLGATTAAVMVACGLNPKKYATPRALEKAAGLNLREVSSGTKQGALHITKRGDSEGRQALYMAALRFIQGDPVVRAWYGKKVARDGGKKVKAIVAVMRKLIKALWHVGRGDPFDATKLFDTKKLELAVAGPTMTSLTQEARA